MSVSPALTSDERTALAGSSTVLRYLSPVVDTVVATARVNQVSFTYPLVQLTVDGTSGGWSNIREGQTVYIGTTSGGTERGIYRVRKAGNSTTIFLQQQGGQDAGLLAVDIRTASFANDDYVTVVERFDMWSVAPRIDVDANTISEDYDKTVGSNNTTPENLVNITVNGRRNHLFCLIKTSTLAITAVASVVKWPTSSGSSVTHSWVYPATFTGVSGASSATFTATAPPGNYTLYYTQHDSIGGDTLRVIVVNIHHPTLNPPILISEMPKSDSRDRTGRRMSFDLYDSRLTELVNGGMVGYFEVCTWNGVDVPTATKQFVGWVQREVHEGSDGLRQATLEIIGPAGLLGMMNSTSQIITAAASPSTWQQCVPSLASAAFMVFYMLRWRAANVLRLFDLTVLSTDPVGQRKPEWIIDKGSLLSQMQSLGTERGNFGANSEGSMFFLHHPSLVNYDDRGSIVVRDDLDASLYAKVTVQVEKQRRVQQVRGEAFTWDGSAELPTPMYADSPKVVAQGSSQTKLSSLVVVSQAELEQITGDGEAQQNNKYPQIDILIQKNRDVFEPAEMALVTYTIPDYLSPTNEEITRRGIPLNVNKTHNPDGTSDMNLSLEGETHNIKGDFVPVPDGNDTIFSSPDIPPIDDPLPLPGGLGDFGIPIPGEVFPTSPISAAPNVTPGRAAIRNTASDAYCTYDIRPSAPTWSARSVPAWFTAISMMIHDDGTPFSRGGYLLGNDGTDSRIAYTPDVYETTPVWTLGATVSGIYSIIKSVRGIPGMVFIQGASTSTFDPSAWAVTYVGTETARGTDGFGYPYIDVDADFHAAYGGYGLILATSGDAVCCDLVDVNITGGAQNLGGIAWAECGEALPSVDGAWPHSSGFINSANGLSLRGFRLTSTTPISYRVRFDTGCGTPIVGSVTAYSSDFGATLTSPLAVDTVTGTPGFDVGPRGIAALAGGDQRVRTSLAGAAYANTVNGGASGSYPISICVPDYKVGSVSTNNPPGAPDFVFAAPVEIASHALWKVTLAGKNGITPSISGTKALGVEPLGLDLWKGKRILFIGDVSGTRYLFVTSKTGTSWSRSAMALAHSVRIRHYSPNGYEAIVAAGTNGLKHTTNGGTSWSTKTASGDNIFAQLFG